MGNGVTSKRFNSKADYTSDPSSKASSWAQPFFRRSEGSPAQRSSIGGLILQTKHLVPDRISLRLQPCAHRCQAYRPSSAAGASSL